MKYQRMIAEVEKFFRVRGILAGGGTPKTNVLVSLIYNFKNQIPPAGALTKDAMHATIRSFAQETLGSSNQPVIRQIVPRHVTVLTPKRTPKTVTAPPVREGFYWSDEWRQVRYEALRESRGMCELCGTGPTPGKPLHVDHIKPRSKFPTLELDRSNLQVLCMDCNLGKSNTDQIDWRKKQG